MYIYIHNFSENGSRLSAETSNKIKTQKNSTWILENKLLIAKTFPITFTTFAGRKFSKKPRHTLHSGSEDPNQYAIPFFSNFAWIRQSFLNHSVLETRTHRKWHKMSQMQQVKPSTAVPSTHVSKLLQAYFTQFCALLQNTNLPCKKTTSVFKKKCSEKDIYSSQKESKTSLYQESLCYMLCTTSPTLYSIKPQKSSILFTIISQVETAILHLPDIRAEEIKHYVAPFLEKLNPLLP